jgi:AraC-like DNA-binding protein
MRGRPYFKEVALHVPGDTEYVLPFRILRVGREQYTAAYPDFRGRVLEWHHLVYVEQGRGRLEYGGYRGPVGPGVLMALCEGVAHDLGPDPDDPMEITWLVLAGDHFGRLAADAGLTARTPWAAIGAASEPRAIFREIRRAEHGSIWRAYALLWQLVARVADVTGSSSLGEPPWYAAQPGVWNDAPGRPMAPPPPLPSAAAVAADDPAIGRSIEAMQMHFRETDLRLDTLARSASLRRSRFLARFRRVTGITPMHYLERVRMEEARRLLEEGTPVVRVAEQVGFQDPLYFSRRFRLMHGLAPTTYRGITDGARATLQRPAQSA